MDKQVFKTKKGTTQRIQAKKTGITIELFRSAGNYLPRQLK